jgi:hypothetical protein
MRSKLIHKGEKEWGFGIKWEIGMREGRKEWSG